MRREEFLRELLKSPLRRLNNEAHLRKYTSYIII